MPEAEKLEEIEVLVPEESLEVTIDVPDRSTKTHGSGEVSVGTGFSGGEDETAEYGKKVEKRIAGLTARMREAERASEELRAQNEALQQERAQNAQRLTSVDSGYLHEFGSRVDTQLNSARADLKDALMRNNPDKIVEAQERLNTAQQEKSQHTRAVRVAEARRAQQPQPQQRPQQQVQQPPQQRQQQQPDERAEAWAKENEWFGKEKPRTFATYGIHQDLVDEGFDARGEEYYDELNKRLRTEFPHKYAEQSQGQGAQQRSAVHQTVAGASRGSTGAANKNQGRGKRVIKLTPGQAAAAREIGVSYEDYAKYIT